MLKQRELIEAYIEREREIVSLVDMGAVDEAIETILLAYEANAAIYIFGNGGSAATASHYANDFNKGLSEHLERKFRFTCLNDNVPTVLAIANDIGYEEVYRFQLRGRLEPHDLVIGISGSGNSPNIVNAVSYARSCNVGTIGITGYDGGELKRIADLSLHVPVCDMQITEDVHMMFDHLMMSVLMDRFGIRGKCS